MAPHPTAGMRDLEKELADSIEKRENHPQDPMAGLFVLTRTMETEEEDQFDVDSTVLDFLAFKATDAVFEWKSSDNHHESDLPNALVTMAAEWRTVLKHRYNGRRLSNQVAFRSRLLQFTLLFTHRMNHDNTWTNEQSLNEIRARNKARGLYWHQKTAHAPALRNPLDTHSEFPLSDGALAENRSELSSALDIPRDRRRWVTDVAGTPSLHCLLPLFVELAAARVSLDDDWEPEKDWLRLLGQFMLQAVFEEYLRNGAFGDEPFNTIFAFGCPGTEPEAAEGVDIQAMRKVFCNQVKLEEQIQGWTKIRRQFINKLIPDPALSQAFKSLKAMEDAQARYPYVEFEAQLLAFLDDLHHDVVKPDLVQVEQGQITINGSKLPEVDTRAMIRRMRLDS